MPGCAERAGRVDHDDVAVGAQHLGHGGGVEEVDAGDLDAGLVDQAPGVGARVDQRGRGHAESGERPDDRRAQVARTTGDRDVHGGQPG